MSRSQRNSPRQKKKFNKLFNHHSSDVDHMMNHDVSYKGNNYHNQSVHHQQSFPSHKPNHSSHHTSHHSQTFPQQNNHSYYNGHNNKNSSHKQRSNNSPYFTSHHSPHHAQPYFAIDETQPLHHSHSGHHQTRSAMPNLAQSTHTPNIHHTKRYSQDHHNRHGNPPKHHHPRYNGKNTTSNPPNIQLKQSSSTKSNIFNHYPPNNIPQSPQHHAYNRHYVVNSPQQHPTKSYGNTYNHNPSLPPRGRTRANTYHQSSPIYTEEDMLGGGDQYPSTFATDRSRRAQPPNHYHESHQPTHSLSQLNGFAKSNSLMDRATTHTYKSTISTISPSLPPNTMGNHNNGNFANFSLNTGRVMNASRSGPGPAPSHRSHHVVDEHSTAALPQYTNTTIAPSLSLDQHPFYNRNYHANSHNEWQQERRHRKRYHSTPDASPGASPVPHLEQPQPQPQYHAHAHPHPHHPPRHIKTDTAYHIYDNVFDRTPSSESSCFSMDDDLRNLQEYHLANARGGQLNKPRTSNKSSKSNKSPKSHSSQRSRSSQQRNNNNNNNNNNKRSNNRRVQKQNKKQQEKKKRKKKKKKGRQAIWVHRKKETDKFFKNKKKSSHKKIVNGAFVYSKSEATKKFLKKRIQQELLFENLPSEMIRKMVKQMYRVDIPPLKNVVCCGDAADAYFVIEKGELEVWRSDNNNELKDRLCAGDTFGDNALLYATTHQYTYRASSTAIQNIADGSRSSQQFVACRCWALSQETFDSIRKKQASSRLESSSRLIKFIKSIAMFGNLDFADLQEISDAMMRLSYRKGDKIVCEGDSSTHFFIIYRGTCDAYKKEDVSKVLKSYSVGDCFGELGIMKNQSRAATVVVTSDQLVAYALPALDFKSLLDYDVVAQSMHQKIDQYLAIPDDCKSFENRVQCSLRDFVSHGCLGVGAFGRVTLVENPKDNPPSVYALKKVRKNRIVETSQQEHIINEKRIMAALDSPFCIKLFATFKDALNVYFLLEPVMGGELFSLLRHEKRLKQRTATFYCACVILAFDYLHRKLNVIYRDLKPENLLISTNGYCKLVDFGFAKKRNNTCTLCGTPQYLAPEVIQNFAHGFAVDWWSVGILIYEMIFGYPPFEGDKNMKMYEKILTAPVEFAENPTIRSGTKDIINSLLRKQAHKRLGAGTKGAQSIKKHAFFKKIDWNKMLAQQIDPPWKPRIKGPHDLSAFDRFPDTTPENEKLIDDPQGDLFKWCDEF